MRDDGTIDWALLLGGLLLAMLLVYWAMRPGWGW